MLQPGRSFSSSDYRYGFNTQEKVDEISGTGNHYTAEFWEYDSRLGKRWNIDPVVKPWESPYATFNNNPVYFNDPKGLDGEGPNNECPGDMNESGQLYGYNAVTDKNEFKDPLPTVDIVATANQAAGSHQNSLVGSYNSESGGILGLLYAIDNPSQRMEKQPLSLLGNGDHSNKFWGYDINNGGEPVNNSIFTENTYFQDKDGIIPGMLAGQTQPSYIGPYRSFSRVKSEQVYTAVKDAEHIIKEGIDKMMKAGTVDLINLHYFERGRANFSNSIIVPASEYYKRLSKQDTIYFDQIQKGGFKY